MEKDIFDFVISQESAYKLPIEPVEGWSWNMSDHVRTSALYKNSQFETENENRTERPFKNIVRMSLNVQYRLEGFDVKDIELYVNNADLYYRSFVIRKFHDKWAREIGLDSFIDEVVESFVDYGGTLVKFTREDRPEVVQLQSLAFADQTDILSGAFAIKHYFTHEQLRKQKGVWDSDAIDMAILQAQKTKKQDKQNTPSRTPSKYIEVYEVHGQFPQSWIDEDADADQFSRQIHIVSFYVDENEQKKGLSFFAKKEPKLPFKFLARDKIFGRALGFGGVEELFEAQAWTNNSEIHKVKMLQAASKMLHVTTDPAFKNKNAGKDFENNDILVLTEGRNFQQMDMSPRNVALFDNAISEWEIHARQISGATEALMGESPSAGTPFKLHELVTLEGKGLHAYRQGKIAVFMDEIYRDWIIPRLQTEIKNEQEFLSELSVDELQQVAEQVAASRLNRMIKDMVLAGEYPTPVQIEEMRLNLRDVFLKKGARQFIKIFAKEMEDTPLAVFTNIAGKQKNMAQMTDKLVNVFRQIIAAPNVLNEPRMVKLLNKILESSGMSPIDFGTISALTPPVASLPPTGQQPTLTA